jgi:hypothetical protein
MKKNQFRNFAIFSAFFLTCSLVGIFYYVNEQLRLEIEKSGEISNATITRVFVNETWSEISVLLPGPGSSLDEIKKNPNIIKIDNRMRRFMSYTDVLKVKLYNARGITLYSSEFSQIGEDKSNNIGFQRASKGHLASELTYRGKFGAFDGELYNRNLVSTYAPIRDGAEVVAVAEIYSDRTSSITQGLKLRNELILLLLTTLVIVYSLMIFTTYKMFFIPASEKKGGTDNLSNNATLQVASRSQPQMEQWTEETISPIPQLALRDFAEMIQYTALYGDLSATNRAKVKINAFLDELSKKGKSILNRIDRYKKLIKSPESFEGSQKVKVDVDHLIESISEYTAAFGTIDSIKFFQGQKFSNSFIQPKGFIEAILTSYIDLIGYGFENAKIQVKFNGSDQLFDIDLVSESSGNVDQSLFSIFQELNQHLLVFSKLHSFKYKATLTDKGLIVSVSLKQSTINSTHQSLKYSDAIVLGTSNTNGVLFDGLLKQIGFLSVHLGGYADVQQLVTTNQRCAFVVFYEKTLKATDELKSLLSQLKKLGIDSKDIVIVLAQQNAKPVLDDNYKVLTMPFVDDDLRRSFINE